MRRIAFCFVVSSLLAAAMAAQGPTFVGVEKCKPCHRPEFETWSQSAHAEATKTAKGAPGFEGSCLSCHATTPDGSLEGVQCEACHGRGSQYWPIPVMMHREKAVAAGLVLPAPGMCNRCHDGQDHHKAVEWGAFKHDHREKRQAVELQ
ncbi:MAG: multiheme c-type cytochrome [Acidobacteriota bacterium]